MKSKLKNIAYNISDRNGQALFEFIAFLPLIIFLIFLLLVMNASINGSINQQKVTRGAFYGFIKGDSMTPSLSDLDKYASSGIVDVGADIIGWKERDEGGVSPYTSCYEMKLFSPSTNSFSSTNECDDPARGGPTKVIKPATIYGICSGNYKLEGMNRYRFGFPIRGSLPGICSLK